jgi:hypothetical protein
VRYIYTVPNGWVRFYCHVADHFDAQVVTYVVLGDVGIVGAIYNDAKEGSANNVLLGPVRSSPDWGRKSSSQAAKQVFNLNSTCLSLDNVRIINPTVS